VQNEAYLSRVLWRGESLPGLHKPLVDELSFQRAQRLLRERGQDMALRRGSPGNYLLSGLVRCGACSLRQKLGRKGCDGDRVPR
jgi:site-specific DNA recombinase